VNANLQAILQELGYEDRTIATAVNATFVPRSERTRTDLQEGDTLEIVTPMQGG
jgi:sulfur carrier protein